jgi:hypothetical protein
VKTLIHFHGFFLFLLFHCLGPLLFRAFCVLTALSGQKQVISSFVFVEGALLPFFCLKLHQRSYGLIEHEMSNNNID